ncbi:hypothetical protein MIND_01188700 [Mycena indigotica]|uniref:non-specific serine/threonine protein kinase n=1 Tax=Mycena indigotica TaxID=2126181 RepID=A0A8H6S4Y0_9AGAR|nr:uncharacterized protein MIND_01188700 [Mycena indigotica]KAF7292896.1 hypothetical protein MIND_01188700 [Mycena indigotica]
MPTLLSLFPLLFTLIFACWAEVINIGAAGRSGDVKALSPSFTPPVEAPASDPLAESDLLDIVLVASVDGKFHALNRTTGHSLWSMPSFATTGSVPQASTMAPLVRTSHPDYDPDLTDDSIYQETYIIEPQSGDIYVMATPTSSLQRFPLSMSELVDLSPFSFASPDDHRVFVGKKETSLLVVELETGKVKATINSECPWDPFEDLHNDDELDLDELDGTKPPMEKPTEVYIGRIDYHVSIHTRPTSKHRPPVQNLSFSTYGPNNQDNLLQAAYRTTKDDAYVQSLPSGVIISFKARESNSLLWMSKFDNPVVAIFDVLRTPAQRGPNTFVLLQPPPQMSAILPQLKQVTHIDQLPHLKSAYIGLVTETGSLFAMSPERFPLVMFSDSARGQKRVPQIEPAHPFDPRELPTELDKVTEARKQREREDALRKLDDSDDRCIESSALYSDRRCLVGIRALEGGDGDGPEMRLKRLIEGVPGVDWQSEEKQSHQGFENTVEGTANTSNSSNQSSTNAVGAIPNREVMDDALLWKGITLGLVIAIATMSLWFGVGRIRRQSLIRTASIQEEEEQHLIATMETEEKLLRPATPLPTQLQHMTPPPSPQVLTAKKLPPLPIDANNDDGDDSERDGEDNEPGDVPPTPGTKRKSRRGNRGKGKKNKNANGISAANGTDINPKTSPQLGEENVLLPNGNGDLPTPVGLSFTTTSSPSLPVVEPSLVVSDTVLGYGSHGTVVYRGSLQGRAVAVKRLLQDFVTLASREVSILQESDDHPNVIRYYYQEAHSNFLYIALELCPASLADLVETPDRDAWRDIAIAFEPKRALRQITSGLKHLHGLKLVHRDIKPQNILVSAGTGRGGTKAYRMLISDFGLCKKLDVDQTSFLPTNHGTMAAGTVGWRAPEILRGDVKLDEFGTSTDDSSVSSQGTIGSNGSNATTGKPTRLTKSVDIFALGCLFFYTLTNGGHPYGDRFEREANIMKGTKNLSGLERFGEEGEEAVDLIGSMLHPEASERPDTTTILLHPFFWDPARRLTFLQDASDRFEIMCRDPKDSHLLILERGALGIVGNDWQSRLDRLFLENLGKFRKYDGRSVQDLLRALRNKKHHYQDLPDNVKRHLGPMPEGFLAYFTRRFPRLFLHVHAVIGNTTLRTESMFRSYFDLSDS